MNRVTTTIAAAITLSLAACQGPDQAGEYSGTRKMWVGEAIHGASVDLAIAQQRTLYPYHFHFESAELNELGERDLGVLADYFEKHGGARLNVRHRGGSEELYQARLAAVSEFLQASGVELFELFDGQPGGDGISSHEAAAAFVNDDPLDIESSMITGSEGVIQ